jgi:hypothetical protein
MERDVANRMLAPTTPGGASIPVIAANSEEKEVNDVVIPTMDYDTHCYFAWTFRDYRQIRPRFLVASACGIRHTFQSLSCAKERRFQVQVHIP